MSEELEILKTVARRLDEAGFAYILTGSIALNYYALPRMTRDIDAVRRALATPGMFHLIHDRFVIKVDFIVRKGQ